MPSMFEMIMVLSMAVSVPPLAMAMWHGWKIEVHRSERENASVDDGGPPWS